MGNRLSKIYTRTGDDGTTGLGDGSRAAKTSARIEAMGAVDELNSIIGLLMTHRIPDPIAQALLKVQHTLFNLGGEISLPGKQFVSDRQVVQIETTLDDLNQSLSPLKDFILPGGTTSAAFCHQARSVCRRAERRLQALSAQETIPSPSIKYLNRLSDLLFVIARTLNRYADQKDVLWDKTISQE